MRLTLILAICLFQCAILLINPTEVDAGTNKGKGVASAPKAKKKYTDEEKEAMKPKTSEEREAVKAKRLTKKAGKKPVEQCVTWSNVRMGGEKKKAKKKKSFREKSKEFIKKATGGSKKSASAAAGPSKDKGKEVARKNLRSCRWDLKRYFNNRITDKEPFALVCQGMMIAMAIETMYAIRNKPPHPYDISVQAILDCYVPDKCFHKWGEEQKDLTKLEACPPFIVLDDIVEKFREDGKAHGIYLKAGQYSRQFEAADAATKHHCNAEKSQANWARGYFDFKMWLSNEYIKGKMPGIEEGKKREEYSKLLNKNRHVFEKTQLPTIQLMMDILKYGPFINVLKVSKRLGEYHLKSEDEMNDLSKAFDLESHPDEIKTAPEGRRELTHTFFVIGYVKPDHSEEIYFLVKTCMFKGPGVWGWQGKGFMKMKTPTGGPYGFNSEIYQVKAVDTNPHVGTHTAKRTGSVKSKGSIKSTGSGGIGPSRGGDSAGSSKRSSSSGTGSEISSVAEIVRNK